jgi:hypothetical protein
LEPLLLLLLLLEFHIWKAGVVPPLDEYGEEERVVEAELLVLLLAELLVGLALLWMHWPKVVG